MHKIVAAGFKTSNTSIRSGATWPVKASCEMSFPLPRICEQESQYKFREHLESHNVYDSAYVPYVSCCRRFVQRYTQGTMSAVSVLSSKICREGETSRIIPNSSVPVLHRTWNGAVISSGLDDFPRSDFDLDGVICISMSVLGLSGAVRRPIRRASAPKAVFPIRARKFLRSMLFLGRVRGTCRCRG